MRTAILRARKNSRLHNFRFARHRGVDSARSPKQLNVRLAERRGIATIRQGIPIAERETSWWESRECEVKYGRLRRSVQSRSNQGTSAMADRPERDAPFVSSNRGIAAADLEMPNSNPKDKAQRRKRPVYCQKNAKKVVQTSNPGQWMRNKQWQRWPRSWQSETPKTGFFWLKAACVNDCCNRLSRRG